MKKFALIGGGVLLAAGLGWTGLWYSGQGAVNARVDAELARIKDQGMDVTSTSRSVGGFPFGYAVTLSEVSIDLPQALGRVKMPTLVGAASVTDPSALTLQFPAQMTVEYTLPPELVIQTPGLPPQITLMVASDALVATIRPAASGERVVETAAKSVKLTYAAPDQSGGLGIGLTDFTDRTLIAAAAGGLTTSAAKIARIDYDYTGKTPEGGSMKMLGNYDAVEIATQNNLGPNPNPDPKTWFKPDSAVLLNLTYAAGPSGVEMTMTGDPNGADGVLNLKAASASGGFGFKDGVMSANGKSLGNVWSLASANPVMPVNGSLTVATIDSGLEMPLRQNAAPQPMALRVNIDGLALDDAAWNAFDPGKALSRDPARIALDLTGMVSVTGDLGAIAPDSPPPFELNALQIKAGDLGALGAEARATGQIDFLQPLMIPTGIITLTTTRALAAVEQLIAAGLIDGEMGQMAQAMAQVYAKPGTTPDSLVSEIAMGADGSVTVNGQPLQ